MGRSLCHQMTLITIDIDLVANIDHVIRILAHVLNQCVMFTECRAKSLAVCMPCMDKQFSKVRFHEAGFLNRYPLAVSGLLSIQCFFNGAFP